MVEIYGIGLTLTFIISVLLCRRDEKRYNCRVQYGMCAGLALFSWIGLIILGIAYREDIKKLFNH